MVAGNTPCRKTALKIFLNRGHALATRLGASVPFELNGNVVASSHQAADLLTMVESGVMTMGYLSASYLVLTPRQ
jgi:hypothetical protein